MTTAREATDPSPRRRPRRHWVAGALTAIVLLTLAGYGTSASFAARIVAAARPAALLADRDPQHDAPLTALSDGQVRSAVAAQPLSQRITNVAMARAVKLQGARVEPWIAQVSQLGWRDTVASQNRLYVAALREDLPTILDVSDALLRRQQLSDQVIPILSVLELDPTLRRAFVARMAAEPNWRASYLTTTAHLRKRDQLNARFFTLLSLRRSGATLDPSEIVQNVRAFERAGLHQLGFGLWKRTHPHVTAPLNDATFDSVSEAEADEEQSVAYEWQLLSGEGFSADSSADESSTMEIDWDGRGVPVFAQQRTSARPGRYVLDVEVAPQDMADLSALTFRLVCDGQNVILQLDSQRPGRLAGDRPVPCAYPLLQIAGDIQPAPAPRQISFSAIRLRRL